MVESYLGAIIQTTGDKVAILIGFLIAAIGFTTDFVIQWGLTEYWVWFGLLLGVGMLAIAHTVDRLEE